MLPQTTAARQINRNVHVDKKPECNPFHLLGLRYGILLRRTKSDGVQKGMVLPYFEADNVILRRRETNDLLDGDFYRICEILQSETFQTFLRGDRFRERPFISLSNTPSKASMSSLHDLL